MTFWRAQLKVNPCVNYRPKVYFSIRSACANDMNVKAFIENLTGYYCYSVMEMSPLEYMKEIAFLPVSDHKNFAKKMLVKSVLTS